MTNDADEIYRSAFVAGLEPDPVLTVSEWAERSRILSSRATSESGPWRNSRTPYLSEIMDSLSATSRVRSVVFMKGAQIGATEAGNNWIGYTIAHDPCPMLVVLPTVELAKRSSRQRIDPMIEDSPEVCARVKSRRERDSGNTILSKEYVGGLLVLTGANSAVGLRSMPFRNGFFDELDAWPGDVDGEGDPEAIAARGMRTYPRSKEFKVSTPTIAGRSRIEAGFLDSDRRFYHVPCPDCDEFQKLVWRNVRWENGDLSTVAYCCEHCGSLIPEYKKTKMLERGIWIPEVPELSDSRRGYHLSSLYSPLGWFSWTEAAEMFTKTTRNSRLLRVFVNTVLGETYEEKGEAPPWEEIYRRRESYKIGTVPAGGVFLTMGVDVQGDYLQGEVVAWGPNHESWSVEAPVFRGDTDTAEPWDELGRYLAKTFEREDGEDLPILRCAIDTGYRTTIVYTWIREQGRPELLMPVKGAEGRVQLIALPKAVDVSSAGRKLSRGLKVWTIGTDLAKGELYGYLKTAPPLEASDPFPAGYCHFPEYDSEFFRQLTAEQLVARIIRGYRRYLWEKTRPRNEAIDCRVYARAAAAQLGMDRMTPEDWERLGSSPPASSSPAKKTKKKTRTGYLDRKRRARGR
jgi:phage terminase large subunit GpA-like protein